MGMVKRLTAVIMACSVVAQAGDLKQFLDELGASYNYTPPSSYRAGDYQVYAGPSLRLSIPNKNISLLTYTPPRFKADCSGIDFSAGAIGYLAENFDTIISNFTTVGLYGMLLGLASTSPTIAEVMKWLQQIEEWVRMLQMKPCEIGMVIGQTAGQKFREYVKTGRLTVSTSSSAEKSNRDTLNKIKSCVYSIADGNFNQALESRLTSLGFSSNVAQVVAYNFFPVVHLNARMDASGQCDFNPEFKPALLTAEEILKGWSPGKEIRVPIGVGTNITWSFASEPTASQGLYGYYYEQLRTLVNHIRTNSVTIDDKKLLYSPVMAPFRNLILIIASRPQYEELLQPIARLYALSVLSIALNDIASASQIAIDKLLDSARITGAGEEFPLSVDDLIKWARDIREKRNEFMGFYYGEMQALRNELATQMAMIEQAVRLEKDASKLANNILGVSLTE